MDRPRGGRRASFQGGSVHVRRSRVLLLAAVMAVAAALSLVAVLVPQSAEANRSPIRKVLVDKQAQIAYAADMRQALAGIHEKRDETWRWDDVMSTARPRYGGYAERSRSLGYRRSVLSLWTQRSEEHTSE